MAHFARVEDTIVKQVIVISDANAPDPAPVNSEPMGQAFIRDVLKLDGEWKQTSYNGTFRKHYAGIGYTYDDVLDAFIPLKPYPSWLLNTETCNWEAPVPYPNDGKGYYWDEAKKEWIIFELPELIDEHI
jgi:hypothetical protein